MFPAKISFQFRFEQSFGIIFIMTYFEMILETILAPLTNLATIFAIFQDSILRISFRDFNQFQIS